MTKVGIIGGTGWVGKAVKSLFPDAVVFTRHEGTKDEINKCDVVFICVPTPLMENGKLDTAIVEYCISWLEVPLIVVRSTVNPGDCASWDHSGKNIVFQPEYLGETPNHPLLDETKSKFLILGGRPENRRKLIELYTSVFNANVTIRQMSLYEAEIVKLTENRAIAFKVMQCQELYDVCEKAKVDYYAIRDAVFGDDPRFNLFFTMIYPEKRGFNSSKCLRKDVPAWEAWARGLGYDAKITRTLVERSNEYARN